MRRLKLIAMTAALSWVLAANPAALRADGGVLLLHRNAGPFSAAVFASPAPPRAGVVDLSVLVQMAETTEPVLDAEVEVTLRRDGEEKTIQATRAQSQNRLLYSAPVTVSAGDWTYTVTIRKDGRTAEIGGTVAIASSDGGTERIRYWPAFVAPLIAIALFAMHQRLRFVQGRDHRAKIISV